MNPAFVFHGIAKDAPVRGNTHRNKTWSSFVKTRTLATEMLLA